MAKAFLYSWIRFDLLGIKKASIRQNLFATTDGGNILVWEKNDKVFDIVSIIISPLEKVLNVKWVMNSQDLAIIGEGVCIFWDVFENEEISRSNETEEIISIFKLDKKYKIFYKDQSSTEKGILLSWVKNNDLFTYDGETVRNLSLGSEYVMEKEDLAYQKRFQKQNKVDDILVITAKESARAPNFRIPSGLVKYIRGASILIIHAYKKHIIYQTPKHTIITDRSKQPRGVVMEKGFVVDDEMLSIQLSQEEVICEGKIVRILLTDYILNSSKLHFSNAPQYIFVHTSNIDFVRISNEAGYMIVNEGVNHRLIDLFKDESMILRDSRFHRDVHLVIEEEKEFLLEWLYGPVPPEGELRFRDILEGRIELLYNYQKEEKLTEQEFLNPSHYTELTKLVIPGWHSVNLSIKYNNEIQYDQKIPLSWLYFLIQRMSNSKAAELLSYGEIKEEEHNIILFGDLQIDEKTFYGIAPIWDKKNGLLAVVSIDKRCYLWDIKKQLPINSFEIQFPIILEFSKNNDYIMAMSTYIKEMRFITREGSHFRAEYPYLQLLVYDINSGHTHKKDIAFTTHFEDETFEILEEEGKIFFTFPHYLDINNNITYEYKNGGFSKINKSKIKRYWQTHSTNTKLRQNKKGAEYKIDQHPEIRRDVHLGPFIIYNYELVRRSDDKTIISALKHDFHAQVSPADQHSFDDASKLLLPFSYNRWLEVFIKKNKRIKGRNLIQMEKMDNLPETITHEIEGTGRIHLLMEKILKSGAYHGPNGIAFQSSKSIDKELKRALKSI